MSNDVYEISGRIKNIIANNDIALSRVGEILVNYYTLAFKDLYDFSETLDETDRANLQCVLRKNEDVPMKIIKVSESLNKEKSLYEQVMEASKSPMFASNQEAYDYYLNAYSELGGDDFWIEAEEASMQTEEHHMAMRARRALGILKHLIDKEKSG